MPDTNTNTNATPAVKEKTAYEKFRDSQGLATTKTVAGAAAGLIGILTLTYFAVALSARAGISAADAIGDRAGLKPINWS